MEGISLISTLAIGFGVALVLGFLAEKLKVPALVGYLLAGILVSPSVFGFDVDLNLANQLAEIGIMLLMFGVGLHFSLTDLLKVKGLVVPGAICQMLLSALIGFGLSWLWGWDVGHSVLLGCCLSCASTVVVLKALEARGMLEGFDGNVAGTNNPFYALNQCFEDVDPMQYDLLEQQIIEYINKLLQH